MIFNVPNIVALCNIASLKNENKDCWYNCNSKQGPCSWCGVNGMCCKQGVVGNGCDGTFGAKNFHGCALKSSKFLCQFYSPYLYFKIMTSVKNKTNVVPRYYHTATAMCLPWPERPTFGCSGGEFKALDRNMRASDTASCQALCLQEQQIGCCYLSNKYGCHWMAGGSAQGDGNVMATSCYAGKN